MSDDRVVIDNGCNIWVLYTFGWKSLGGIDYIPTLKELNKNYGPLKWLVDGPIVTVDDIRNSDYEDIREIKKEDEVAINEI